MRVILFNLYPYRVLRENKRRRRVFAELAGGLALGLLICLAIDSEFDSRVADKQQFLSNLSAMEADVAVRVQQVQALKDRVAVLSRQVNALQLVEQESVLASQWVSYLDASVPDTVSLTRLLVEENVMFISGFTNTVSSLAQWVDQMEAGNTLFESVELVSVTEPANNGGDADKREHMFEMKVMLRRGVYATR